MQIIEDEPLHANLLGGHCQAHFSTALDADGHSGWNNVQRLQPSLILLDVMLPGMNGPEFAGWCEGTPATRHIPIIMLTAVGTEEDRVAGLEMGADDYVVKSFSPREVVSAFKPCCGESVKKARQGRWCALIRHSLWRGLFRRVLQERHHRVESGTEDCFGIC